MHQVRSQIENQKGHFLTSVMSLVGLLIFSSLVISCTKTATLNPLNSILLVNTPTDQVQVNFCTPPAVQQEQHIKTIIILDHSGSNAENYKMTSDGTGAPDVSSGDVIINASYATDPKGLTRYGTPTTSGTLLNYLANLAPNSATDPTRFFALVDFNSGVTTYPAGSSGFTSDITSFYNYVYTDAGTASGGAPNDSGGTSYLTALGSAYNIITNDIQAASTCAALSTSATPTASCPSPGVAVSSSYVIVFMSDGSPITSITGVGVDGNGNTVLTGAPIVITKESSAEILSKVGTIVDLKSNDKYVTSVNLYTIYYYVPGNVDTSGQTLLGQMAKAGNGLPYNALSGTNIDYSQFQAPKKLLQYTFSDAFVTNASAVWWSDGKYHLDTDGDGLPDDIETAWGTDPTKASTAGNGVSDLVRYRLANGAACANLNTTTGLCQDAVPNYKTGLCNGITNSTVAGAVVFKASDPDGLNDCEKLLLTDSPGIGTPDSNADNIPDFLEFLNNIPFQNGTSPAVTSINQDGYTTYQKIKYSLPVTTPLANSIGVIPAAYNLTQVSTIGTQTCYQLNVTNLPIVGSGNKVRVDILMKSNLVQDSYLYKIGYKSFSPTSAVGATLQFNDWTDATEISNNTWSSWP